MARAARVEETWAWTRAPQQDTDRCVCRRLVFRSRLLLLLTWEDRTKADPTRVLRCVWGCVLPVRTYTSWNANISEVSSQCLGHGGIADRCLAEGLVGRCVLCTGGRHVSPGADEQCDFPGGEGDVVVSASCPHRSCCHTGHRSGISVWAKTVLEVTLIIAP